MLDEFNTGVRRKGDMATAPGAFSGVREAFPIFLALFPVGASFGTMAAQAGLAPLYSVAMSALVFAGAAQFMALGMIAAGATPIEIVVATFVVNLRNFVSGVAIVDRIPLLSPGVKLALSHAITDESCAFIGVRFDNDGALDSPAFVAAAMYSIVASWVAGTAFGAYFSYLIPKSIMTVMGVGITTMFICLLVPALRLKPRYAAITLAAALLDALFRTFLSGGAALVAATILASALMIEFDGE